MELKSKTERKNGSSISAAGNEENAMSANKSVSQGSMKVAVVAPVIDSDRMNVALMAANNPREALRQIRTAATEARWKVRNGADKSDVFALLNRIVLLSGGAC